MDKRDQNLKVPPIRLSPSVEEVVVLDGFDDAMIGVSAEFGTSPARAIYDVNAFIDILADEKGMSPEEARWSMHAYVQVESDRESGPLFVFLNGEKGTVLGDNLPLLNREFGFSH